MVVVAIPPLLSSQVQQGRAEEALEEFDKVTMVQGLGYRCAWYDRNSVLSCALLSVHGMLLCPVESSVCELRCLTPAIDGQHGCVCFTTSCDRTISQHHVLARKLPGFRVLDSGLRQGVMRLRAVSP